MSSGRDNRALVDQRHPPTPELAGAGYRVVYIGERDARNGTRDKILVAVGQCDLSATLERDARLNEFQTRFVSSRVERNSSRVGDDTAQRQQGAVADGHPPSDVRDRRLIEYEVACTERSRGYAIKRDRLCV